ncbi:OmpH family outer membrane protein [Pseudodesulfovibrio cashew]|uniref:OmpH family outer membrane protein n=1 Tax=Pseudodesulfovibrio cashew TaxID=2678688 RepID=A0A6I6JDY7_9BACT|nr:OmpH family outer membrane protein [Pseudodesulfovibrio cashew]QGY41045.1 OmpH family outer membrane protein [Pseudodesulfovibrio cashew]
MKKALFMAVVFTLVLSATAYAEPKIGIVNIQAAVLNSDYGKEIAKSMQQKFEPMQKELEKEAAEIKKLEDELKNQNVALKLEARQDRQREFRRKIRDHQDSLVAFRQKVQAESEKQRQPILERVIKVIDEYGKSNGYTVIIESTNNIVYAADGVDVTKDIVNSLNKLKKAGK